MEKLPPQRRPGIIFNRLAAKCDDSDRTASKSRFESASKPEQFSFARGRLMETVLAYIKPAPCQIKPKDPMPFQYAPKSTSPTACQCYREKKNILCQACGHRFEGRVRTRCPIHPTVIHLMDLEACPNCLATHLKEFSTVTKRSP